MDFDIELLNILRKRKRITDGFKPAKKKRMSLNLNLPFKDLGISIKGIKRSKSGGLYRVFV